MKIYVEFNSTKENFLKERSGKKRNTVRWVDPTDPRFSTTPTHIIITCREFNNKRFERKITDITCYLDGYRIFSW